MGMLVVLNALINWFVFRQISAATGQPVGWQIWINPAFLFIIGVLLVLRLRPILPKRSATSTGAAAKEDQDNKRLVYVGTDSFREGRTCGDMMGQALNGRGKVAVITREYGQSIQIRESGFSSILEEKYPQIEIVAHLGEKDQYVADIGLKVAEIIQNIPDLGGIYVVDGNTPAIVIKALNETGKARKIKLVCHDMIEATMQGIVEGIVTATISQDPFAQGYDPVIHLYNYLAAGKLPARSKMTTEMVRITPENYQQYWDPNQGVIETEVSQKRRVQPVDQRPRKPLRIVVLGIDPIASVFYTPIQEGALAAAALLKDRNTLVEYIDPARARNSGTYDSTTFGPAIDDYRDRGYDGITLPVYDKNIVDHINRAVEAGVAVATYNSEPENINSLMHSLVQQSRSLLDISVALSRAAADSGERAGQINQAIRAMRQALNLEAESASQAIESTQQIAQAINGIDRGAEEQTQAATRASQATEDISQAVSGTQQASLNSEQTSTQAASIARQGAQTIQQTLQQIEEISTAVNASADKIHALNQLSRQIDAIVASVNAMAEQSNLLALNASIEAARAGEQGSGFAVVAGEMRSLAEQSKRSTQEIASLVRAVQHNALQMVETSDEATRQAAAGKQLAGEAGQAIHSLLQAAESMRAQTEQVVNANTSVVQALNRLTDANQRVSAVIVENAAMTRQVTRNIQETFSQVNHMTGISKDNANTIEGVHSLSNEVADQSAQLKDRVISLVQMAEELQGAVVAFRLIQESE